MHTSDRTQLFTESVIREMTRVAQEHDAINLAQGFPDFPAPDLLKEAAAAAIHAARRGWRRSQLGSYGVLAQPSGQPMVSALI